MTPHFVSQYSLLTVLFFVQVGHCLDVYDIHQRGYLIPTRNVTSTTLPVAHKRGFEKALYAFQVECWFFWAVEVFTSH